MGKIGGHFISLSFLFIDRWRDVSQRRIGGDIFQVVYIGSMHKTRALLLAILRKREIVKSIKKPSSEEVTGCSRHAEIVKQTRHVESS